MKKLLLAPLVLLITIALAACESDFFADTSTSDAIAAGYLAVEGLANTTLALSEQGLINSEDRGRIRTTLQRAKDSLDVAATFLSADRWAEAESELQQAQLIISTVQSILEGFNDSARNNSDRKRHSYARTAGEHQPERAKRTAGNGRSRGERNQPARA